MKEIKRNNKGITLIALIITIIVMLILAGVTINLTLGENGIFTTAQQAAKNYTDAQNKEMADLGDFTNLVNNTINDLGQSGSNGGTQTPTYATLASKAKPGDYVEYDGGNGYTGAWQVLYNDSTNGLQIISSTTVTDTFTLGGSTEAEAKASYNSAIDTLNTECRKYVNISYAKDANAGRCVGSNPTSPDDEVTDTDTVKLQFTYNDTTESGCKVVGTAYFGIDIDAMNKATSQNETGIKNINKTYWLASRHVYDTSSVANFSVKFVKGTSVGLLSMWSSGNSASKTETRGLRPVITLASEVQTSSGDGSDGNAFKLVAK